MNVLLTNDDGINGEGLIVLMRFLEQAGHSVYVVAPDGNRSGVSMAISLFDEHTLVRHGTNMWSYSGTPADCVITALTSNLLPVKIDAVVSGINAGANIGTDVIYSGTCAAARQAALYGYPGIAVSLEKEPLSDWDDFNFEPLALFTASNLEEICRAASLECPRGFVNINACNIKEFKSVVVCDSLSVRNYNDRKLVEETGKVTSDGKPVFTVRFRDSDIQTSAVCKSDFHAVSNGCIALSLVQAEPGAMKVEKNMNFTL